MSPQSTHPDLVETSPTEVSPLNGKSTASKNVKKHVLKLSPVRVSIAVEGQSLNSSPENYTREEDGERVRGKVGNEEEIVG